MYIYIYLRCCRTLYRSNLGVTPKMENKWGNNQNKKLDKWGLQHVFRMRLLLSYCIVHLCLEVVFSKRTLGNSCDLPYDTVQTYQIWAAHLSSIVYPIHNRHMYLCANPLPQGTSTHPRPQAPRASCPPPGPPRSPGTFIPMAHAPPGPTGPHHLPT